MTSPTPPKKSNVDHIVAHTPDALKLLPQWVAWKFVRRDDRWTKCPVCPTTGRLAKANDPSTWASFDLAIAACRRSPDLAGVGFMFTGADDFCGVDLDDSLDEAGQLKPWAAPFVTSLSSYTEVSPSGTGLKIFIRAAKPGTKCRRAHGDGEVEIYDRDRFFTVTGEPYPQTPTTVEERPEALAAIYAAVFPEDAPRAKRGAHGGENGRGEAHETDVSPAILPTVPPVEQSAAPLPSSTFTGEGAADHPVNMNTPEQPADSASEAPVLSDDTIIAIAQKQRRTGAKFTALFAGDWEPYFKSESEADASIIFTLAFYTKDPAQLDRLYRRSGLVRDKWDAIHGDATYGAALIAKALARVTDQYVPKEVKRRRTTARSGSGASALESPGPSPGSTDPSTGRLILCSRRTVPTAEAFVQRFHSHPAGRTMHHYGGELWEWRHNRYVPTDDDIMRHRLFPWMHAAVEMVRVPRTGEFAAEDFPANPHTVAAALNSIKAHVQLPADKSPPMWLQDRYGQPDPRELLPCRSSLLHLPTMKHLPPTPALFNVNAIDCDPDPQAPMPELWLTFLHQLFDGDSEALDLLQEWFGYCLTGDTSQQKMFLIIGPKRSGKGTIARVLTRLLGRDNVCGPTVSSLATDFGLQPLLGKSLAIVSDARFKGSETSNVLERLLCISGEDFLTIDRKYQQSVTVKLPTRFLFLTNELPRLADASGAIASRFLLLQLTNSFYGKEDHALSDRLAAELPGVLNWAIAGWHQLRERGRFQQPKSSENALKELAGLTSPMSQFVEECCDVGPDCVVPVAVIFEAWRTWCNDNGRAPGHRQQFGRELRAYVPGVALRHATGNHRFYQGVNVRATGAA